MLFLTHFDHLDLYIWLYLKPDISVSGKTFLGKTGESYSYFPSLLILISRPPFLPYLISLPYIPYHSVRASVAQR